MKLRTALVAAAALVGSSAAAFAAPITGQISLIGYADAIGAVGMGAATGIDFVQGANSTTASVGTPGGLTSFGAGTGSFAALGSCANVGGGCGTIRDIANFQTSAPISSFITFTTGTATQVSFDLSQITEWAPTASDNTLRITALGTINFTGLDSTAGQFTLTAQGNNIVSFSATTLAALSTVPEPASLALLGGSLAALGLLRRKKA